MTSEPSSVRSVRFPAAYGTPGGPDPNARPHARPVDGVWVGGALCFGGSPETRWVSTSRTLHIPSPRYPRLLRSRSTRSTSPEVSRHSGRSGRSGPPGPLRGPSRASHVARRAGASRRRFKLDVSLTRILPLAASSISMRCGRYSSSARCSLVGHSRLVSQLSWHGYGDARTDRDFRHEPARWPRRCTSSPVQFPTRRT
jgi:hypothetical protein